MVLHVIDIWLGKILPALWPDWQIVSGKTANVCALWLDNETAASPHHQNDGQKLHSELISERSLAKLELQKSTPVSDQIWVNLPFCLMSIFWPEQLSVLFEEVKITPRECICDKVNFNHLWVLLSDHFFLVYYYMGTSRNHLVKETL